MLRLLIGLILLGALSGLQSFALDLFPISVPSLNLDYWNSTGSVLSNNNCYNYATNRRTDSFAQPGESAGKKYSDITCFDVKKAVQEDMGIEPVEAFAYRGKQDFTLIALVVGPGWDFHWYRRDDNGMWSHKPGATKATIYDKSGQVIVSPETANRGSYKDFCGYFVVRNQVLEAHEQNGGFVKIGNMPSLPPLALAQEQSGYEEFTANSTKSEVELLLYSGRRNPKIDLQELLNDPSLKSSLTKLTDQTYQIFAKEPSELSSQRQFEFQGVRILDRQGLLFPAGTEMTVDSQQLLVHSGLGIMAFEQQQPDLAQQILQYYQRTIKAE
ncbi:MAG: hypothetical protein KDD61_08790 [Bdellovibrionales bacterium]|nr:hypothetical protein [Bdellovibrionales bacterium]